MDNDVLRSASADPDFDTAYPLDEFEEDKDVNGHEEEDLHPILRFRKCESIHDEFAGLSYRYLRYDSRRREIKHWRAPKDV